MCEAEKQFVYLAADYLVARYSNPLELVTAMSELSEKLETDMWNLLCRLVKQKTQAHNN